MASMAFPRIPIDYSLTYRESLVQAAVTMLDHGMWAWVLYCAAMTVVNIKAEKCESSVKALPTWVPDPHFSWFTSSGLTRGSPMRIERKDWKLICDVRCLGTLHGSEDQPELRWDPLFWEICSEHKKVDDEHEQGLWDIYENTDHGIVKPAPLQPKVKDDPSWGTFYSSWSKWKFQVGDILCSCSKDLGLGDVLLVLRRSGSRHADSIFNAYNIAGVELGHQLLWTQTRTDDGWRLDEDFRIKFVSCPKIEVTIV